MRSRTFPQKPKKTKFDDMKKMLFASLVFFSLAFVAKKSKGFERLIAKQTDPEVVKQLEAFKKKGIEKEVDLSTLTPDHLVFTAKQYLGAPHHMGGTTKKGMDCSGLVMQTFIDNRIVLPHSSHEQARYGEIIPEMEELKKGDLVFFIKTYGSGNLITHSGIMVSDTEFIHVSVKKGCSIANLEKSEYWKEHFLMGTRIFKE